MTARGRPCDNRPGMTATGDANSLAFERRADRRVLLGVAGGFADQHGLDVIVVRAALVMLSFAGGLGIVIYVLGHVLAETRRGSLRTAQPHDQRRNLSVAAIAIGLAMIMRSTGLWIDDSVMTVIIVVCAGVALLGVLRPADGSTSTSTGTGMALDPAGRDSSSTLAAVVAGQHALWRIIAGGTLIALGLVLVGASRSISSSLRVGVYATALTIVGVTVLLGPWLARVAQEMTAERRQRIRLDERAAMAAHLHDSVLQTLALIQRSADDPRRTITLARRQEAELRQWLYGNAGMAATTLSGALQAMVDEVEDLYDIRVEPVVVGDQPMNGGFAALIAATREACVNAAKHSNATDVSVYVEVTADAVEAFVRDRGVGFDLTAATEGQGIAHSITARLERIGGAATIESALGSGTEVRLSVPLGSTVPAHDEIRR
jgi:signal transduction histidine kinase/phage shock protein PspC (stress-responsive transcriptional regulator)